MTKVLILDDNPDILDATAMLLTSKGFYVQTSINKEDFINKYQALRPEVVIIDILLQGIDGRDICTELRANPENSKLCIFLFSASPDKMQDYSSFGANGCLEKPYEIKALVEAIHNCLSKL